MKELLEKINEEIVAFQRDATLHVEKGNQAAGRRARKSSSVLTKLLKDFRAKSTGRK